MKKSDILRICAHLDINRDVQNEFNEEPININNLNMNDDSDIINNEDNNNNVINNNNINNNVEYYYENTYNNQSYTITKQDFNDFLESNKSIKDKIHENMTINDGI